MKLAFPASTLTILLSSGVALSKAQTVRLSTTAVEKKYHAEAQGLDTAVQVDQNKANTYWEDKFTHLKEMLKAKSNLRMKMWSRDVHLTKTDMKCLTAGMDNLEEDALADNVGILVCHPEDISVKDSASSLGGVCA
jgi:hypothetical protein